MRGSFGVLLPFNLIIYTWITRSYSIVGEFDGLTPSIWNPESGVLQIGWRCVREHIFCLPLRLSPLPLRQHLAAPAAALLRADDAVGFQLVNDARGAGVPDAQPAL